MQLFKTAVVAFATMFLKIFLMAAYSAWALKLGVLETNMHPLFGLLMVLLSIFGLWQIVRKLADFTKQAIERSAGNNDLP